MFIGLYAYIYIVPSVSDIFVETYIAEYGTLEIGEETEFLVVRDERLYTADESGEVDRVVSAGKLMRKNSRIVTVGSTAYYSQNRGIVSYHYDGLETVYTAEDMANIGIKALNTKNDEGEEKNPVKECVKTAQSGSPIFKIIDNKAWYVICWLESAKAEGMEPGKTMSVRFDDGTQLEMKVHQVNDQGKNKQLILSCNRDYKNFDRIRTGTCKLIKTSRNGILLESDSIIEQDGQTGVNVINKLGNAVFIPVKILAADGKTTVVESGVFRDSEGKPVETINNYAEILRVSEEETKDAN